MPSWRANFSSRCAGSLLEVVTMVQSYDGATKVTSLVYSYQGFQFLIA